MENSNMTNARTQAVAQRRNLLNIEAEYANAIERLLSAAKMTRREIEKIEEQYGLEKSSAYLDERVRVWRGKTILDPIDTQPEKL